MPTSHVANVITCIMSREKVVTVSTPLSCCDCQSSQAAVSLFGAGFRVWVCGPFVSSALIQLENRATVTEVTIALERRRAIERALVVDHASRRVSAGDAVIIVFCLVAESMEHGLVPTQVVCQVENGATSIDKLTTMRRCRRNPTIFCRAVQRAVRAEGQATHGVRSVGAPVPGGAAKAVESCQWYAPRPRQHLKNCATTVLIQVALSPTMGRGAVKHAEVIGD